MAPEIVVRRFLAGALSPLEAKVLDYLANDAEDADTSPGGFARAPTYEVAEALKVSNDAAYKALASLARKKLVSKAGRVKLDKTPGGWTGEDKKVGWQLWEVYFDKLPPGVLRRQL